jgi:hypothetical protein
MRCPSCGLENVDAHVLCPSCKQPLRAKQRVIDERSFETITGGIPIGRVRPVTIEEDLKPDTMFRADAVLALTGPAPGDLSPFEAHVAGLIDGVRPVARVRKKSGVSSSDWRIALNGLAARKLLRVVGIVEEAVGVFEADITHDLATSQNTVAGAQGDVIPPNVMLEIQRMLAEEEIQQIREGQGVKVGSTFDDGETESFSEPTTED